MLAQSYHITLKMVRYFGKKKRSKAITGHDEERGPCDEESSSVQKESFRKISSMTKLSRSGFLTPALVLVPAADGVSKLVKCSVA